MRRGPEGTTRSVCTGAVCQRRLQQRWSLPLEVADEEGEDGEGNDDRDIDVLSTLLAAEVHGSRSLRVRSGAAEQCSVWRQLERAATRAMPIRWALPPQNAAAGGGPQHLLSSTASNGASLRAFESGCVCM